MRKTLEEFSKCVLNEHCSLISRTMGSAEGPKLSLPPSLATPNTLEQALAKVLYLGNKFFPKKQVEGIMGGPLSNACHHPK